MLYLPAKVTPSYGSIVSRAEGCVRVSFVFWGTECFLYMVDHRVDLSLTEYLNYFVSAHNTRASGALDELALVIPRCRTDQLSRSFLPAAGGLLNLLLSGVFSSDTEFYELVPTAGLT